MKCKTFAIRALVMLLCVTMLIGMIPVYVSATNSVKIEVGTATIDLAEDVATDGYYTVNIPINITENTGLIWIGLDVTYDPKLDLVDWTEGEVFPYIDGTLDAGLVDYEMSTINVTSRQAADFEKNPFHVSYQGGTLKANNTKTGTLINLVFKVPDTIGKGEYPISVAVDTILSQEDTDGSDGYDAPVDITSSASATAGKLVAKKTYNLDSYYVFDSSDIGYSSTTAFTPSKVNLSENDTSYLHFASKAGTSGDNTRINVSFADELFPEGFTLLDYKYMKIGYRSNIASGNLIDINPYPAGANGGRAFGCKPSYSKDTSVWNGLVVDLSTSFSGGEGIDKTTDANGDGKITATDIFLNNFDGDMDTMILKPYRTSSTDKDLAMLDGEFFDVQYIGFFKDKAEADAYTFTQELVVDAMFDVANGGLTGSVGGGLAVETVEAVTATTTPESAHIRFTSTQEAYDTATTGTNAEKDGIRAYANLNVENYPTGYNFEGAKYMKIGFRSGATNTGSQYNPIFTNGTRLWGTSFTTNKNPGNWDTVVIDLTTQNYTGGEGGSLSGSTAAERWEFVNEFLIKQLLLRPFNTTDLDPANGAYFDVRYVAFFSDVDSANGYVHPDPERKKYTVTFVKNGETGEEFETVEVSHGDGLTYPANVPTIIGKFFTNWDVAEGTTVTENMTVTAVYRDAAEPIAVTTGSDMKFNFNYDNYPVIFYHIDGTIKKSESFSANGDSYNATVFDVTPAFDYADGIWKFKEDINGWYGAAADNNITAYLNFPADTVKYLALGISVNCTKPGAYKGDVTIATDAGNITASADFTNTESGITNVIIDVSALPEGAKNIRYITFNPWMTSGGNIANGSTVYVQYVAGYATAEEAADGVVFTQRYTAPAKHSVSVATAEHLTVTVDNKTLTENYAAEIYHGDRIYITATADEGYTFDGWYNAADEKVANKTTWYVRNASNGIDGAKGDMLTVEGDLALTPKVLTNPTVTFKYGDEIVATQSVAPGSALAYPDTVTGTVPEGKVFTTWDVAEGFVVREDIVVNAVFDDESTAPVALLDGQDISITAESMGTTTKVYDAETGITTITITADKTVESEDNEHFKIYLPTTNSNGDPVYVKTAPYIVLGMSMSSGKSSDTSIELSNKMRPWGKKFTYPTVYSKYIIDVSKYTNGGNNFTGVSNLADDVQYAHLRFRHGYSLKTTLPAGTELKVGYVALFDDLAKAEAWVYKPHTITFMANGEVFATKTIGEFDVLTYPAERPTATGMAFSGWDVPEGTVITEDMVVTAMFEDAAGAPLAILDGGNVQLGVNNINNTEVVYDIKTGITNLKVLKDFTSTSSYDDQYFKIYIPQTDINGNSIYAKDAPYVVLGMSYSIDRGNNSSIQLNGGRAWGRTFNFPTTYSKYIVDLTKFTGGDGNASKGYSSLLGTETYNYLRFRFSDASDVVLPAETELKVGYVALFDDLEKAEAWVYKARTVTFMSEGEVFATVKISKDGALTYPEGTPTVPGKFFTGWDVAEGTTVTDNMTVTAQYRDAVEPIIVASGSDMKFNFSTNSYPINFYHICGVIIKNNESFSANGDTYTSKVYDVASVFDYADGIWKFKEDINGWYGAAADNNITTYLNFPADTVKYLALGISVNCTKPGAYKGDVTVATDAGNITASADFTNTESGITNVIIDVSALPEGAKNIRYITFNPWMTSGGNIANGSTVYVQYVAGYATAEEAADGVVLTQRYTAPAKHSVSIATATGLTVTVDSKTLTENYAAEIYHGDRIYLTATADEGYVFDGWYNAADEKVANTTSWIIRTPDNLNASTNITGDMLTIEGDLALTPKVTKTPKVTANVSGTNGTFTVDGGEAVTTYTGSASVGTTVTFVATANDGYKIDGWYDVTNGHNIRLTKDSTYTLTVSKNVEIEVRFIDETVADLTKLAVATDENGKISVSGGDAADNYGGYTNGGSTVEVTAHPNTGYVTAYWTRVTSDGATVYVGVGDTVNVAPLGDEVTYKPVFVADGTTMTLYLDAQGSVVGSFTGAHDVPSVPSRVGYTNGKWDAGTTSGIVTIYKATYTKDTTTYSLTINYADGSNKVINYKYNQQIKIKATTANPVWKITIGGVETVLSYASEFVFGASFTTDIVITETTRENEAEAIVMGLEAVYDASAGKIKFVATFELPEGATLVERGVLMTSDSGIAASMEIGDAGVITGRVTAPVENATKVFIINKSKVTTGATWYGRPYIIYTQGGVTKTLYADTMNKTAE